MKEKLFDNPVVERAHPICYEGGSGTHRIYHFPNGFGASLVRSKMPERFLGAVTLRGGYFSYTRNENEWELAVVKFRKANDHTDFRLDYSTRITRDVIGYLTEPEVEKVLQRIKRLRRK